MSITAISQNQAILSQSMSPQAPETKTTAQAPVKVISETSKDTLNFSINTSNIKAGFKGAGAGALAVALPTVPIGLYMIKHAGSGTGGIGPAMAGLGIAAAGALGGLVGGAVAASTTDSKLNGALYGGAAAALAGAALTGLVLSKSGMNPGTAMKIAALAFGATGAIGGAIGSNFAVKQ